MSSVLEALPEWIWDVPYAGSRYPGSAPRASLRESLLDGANCQLFAYEVTEFFGISIPDLRSDELWNDATATAQVESPAPLDLALFHGRPDAWGAHVAIVVDEDSLLHLCAEVGRPAVWRMDEFAKRARHRCLIGFKRPRAGRTVVR